MLLSARLIRMIEEHADEVTRALISELHSNSHTLSYHQISREDLRRRVYGVYRNLGNWGGNVSDEAIESAYQELGRKRGAHGIPLNEVVYALILTKYHLRNYIRDSGMVDSAVDLYQEQELHRLVGQFFDKAIYYTVKGYESETAAQASPAVAAHQR